MKTGYKTTEFWLSAAAMVVGLLLASGMFEPAACKASWCGTALQALGLVATLLAQLGYTASRAMAKKDAAKKEVALAALPLGE